MRKLQGTTTVEFAIAGSVFFLVLFGAIEVARMMWARSVLEEGVRRGARLAAVCRPEDSAAVRQRASFPQGGGAALVPGFTSANLRVEYLDSTGVVRATDPSVAVAANVYVSIRYVRVTVQNFTMPLVIPFLNRIFQPNGMSSTLPRESLGVAAEGFTTC